MLDKARAVAWAELHRRQLDTESTGASLKATVRLDCDLILAMKRDPPFGRALSTCDIPLVIGRRGAPR